MPSRLANWAISTPWLYGIMKVAAKFQLKKMTTDNGVPWDAHVSRLQAIDEIKAIKAEIEDATVTYPDYFSRPFHAYPEGNMCWLAAFEIEPASYAVALRTFQKLDPECTAAESYRLWRSTASNAIQAYYAKNGLASPSNILDVGCSVGLSTRWIAETYPDAASITGLDLSPYFLAVAEYEERQRAASGAPRRIKYVHGSIENHDVADGSIDMMAFHYVIHECPGATIQSFCDIAARVVKPGGAVVFVDNNPMSKTMQSLPPPIAVLLKSTEPWSDEYFAFDVEGALRAAGFDAVTTVETDHRHRAVMGVKR